MAQVAAHHFSTIPGSHEDHDLSVDIHAIGHPSFDLTALGVPFTEAMIWDAMKRLPASKARGADGFTSEFLCAFWDISKGDICDASVSYSK